MVFSSLVFLFVFMPVCIILYFAAPTLRIKNLVLMALSLFFYAWGEPVWVVLLLISSLSDFVAGHLIERFRGTPKAKTVLICAVIVDLGMLMVFKYLGFFIDSINAVTGLGLPGFHVALPIGISFYTFQTMSYTIDLYKGETKVQRSFTDFLLFVSLFPQLIAGPILRYSEIAEQLDDRKTTLDGVFYGITRFMCGLGKKVLIANYAGNVAANLLDERLTSLTSLEALIGILAFAFQIYFDFSGYSDMAIGLGRIFGFKYSENFNLPYTARSITDFWRRWHISLSSFFRDYVYIPLGGNRRLQIRNLFIVWFLTGLWHGASWNFVLWGLYFFLFLIIEKFLLTGILEKIPRFFCWLYSFIVVLIGWVLFYFTDLANIGVFFSSLFGLSENGFSNQRAVTLLLNNLPLLSLCAFASSPIPRYIARFISPYDGLEALPEWRKNLCGICTCVYCAVLLFTSTASLVGSSYNPFLYFRF